MPAPLRPRCDHDHIVHTNKGRSPGTMENYAERLARAARFGPNASLAGRLFGLQVVIKGDKDVPVCYMLRDPSLLIGGDWVRDAHGNVDQSRLCNLTCLASEAWRGSMGRAAWMHRSHMRKFDPSFVYVELLCEEEFEEFQETWHGQGPLEDADW